jgi:predicted nucleotidyltransferase
VRVVIDTSLESRLARIFMDQPVVCAYLFGSQAKRTAGPLSDVDIAIYFDEAVAREEYFELRLEVLGELIDSLRTDDVDLIVLNDAPPLLAHRVLKEGQLLFSADERRRVELEVRTVLGYLDWKPYVEKYTRETLGSGAEHDR